MKTILTIQFCLLLLFSFGQQQSPQNLRHFMQSGPTLVNAIQYGNNPKDGRYANTGDAKMYYEVYGKGQPIVVLHGGIFGSIFEMYAFIDSLSKYYQVIAISTRGHGKSSLGNQPITYEQKATDVMAVINAVTSDSVIVLGFSDGGYAGYKLAEMYPSRIKKLIAIGATELSPGVREFNFDVKQAIALDTSYWQQQLKLMPEPQRLQEMFTLLGKMYNGLTLNADFFSKIKCPVLVMAGERDQSNPPARVLSTAEKITQHQIGIIPNCGHGVFLENFAAVWACVLPFLKQ